jgi:hypothetical protein
MTDSQSRGIGVSMDFKPHAYDPVANPSCSGACWRGGSSLS